VARALASVEVVMERSWERSWEWVLKLVEGRVLEPERVQALVLTPA
jgi:hypothetical protein